MQPVEGNAHLNQDEAAWDGTALIGDTDSDKTDRIEFPQQPNHGDDAGAVGQDWQWISERLAHLFSTGVTDNDPRTQEVIHEHYRWICHFWVPDRDSYIRLGQMYVNQPKFRKRIERKKPAGLATYLRDAMTAYAWSFLN
ncbi:hypothetical protein FHX42_002581 [Saccharopolyspora lacisalsi]|uniref:TipAS antibiotic-recognition domain-containing protein n=1 Tax=Halosaccharopolyspora lacisalsi TaxID=1000566 RepID=A0A839DWG7_9PSEU|nr:TipAS antibiotic-recognition domain-containing protein [Halosaccharopolyspora lacisalsi]MBA8825230.1 hypothetical protein [Halosaccharopolyspora lacisalsi]